MGKAIKLAFSVFFVKTDWPLFKCNWSLAKAGSERFNPFMAPISPADRLVWEFHMASYALASSEQNRIKWGHWISQITSIMSFSYSMFFVKINFSFNKNTQIATLIWKALDFAMKKRNLGLIKYDEFWRGIIFGIMSHNMTLDTIYCL